MDSTSPTMSHLDGSKWLTQEPISRIRLALFFLFVLVIPIAFLRHNAKKLIEEEEGILRQNCRNNLLREMEQFETDIDLKNKVQEFWGDLEAGFLTARDQPRPRLKRPRARVEALMGRFPGFLEKRAVAGLGAKPLLVFCGSGENFDSIEVSYDASRFSGLARPSRTAARDVLRYLAEEGFASPGSAARPEESVERKKSLAKKFGNHLNTLFGKHLPEQVIPGEVRPLYATKFRNQRFFLYSRFFLAEGGRTGAVPAGYFAVFSEQDFSFPFLLKEILRKGRRRGLNRKLRFSSARRLSSFFQGGGELGFFRMMSFSLLHQFADVYQQAIRRQDRKYPILVVAQDERFLLSPFRKVLPLFSLVLALVSVMALLAVFSGRNLRFPLSLQTKFGLLTFLVVSLPLAAFLMASAAGERFRSRADKEETFDLMTRRLAMSEQLIPSLEMEIQNHLIDLAEEVVPLMNDEKRLEQRIGESLDGLKIGLWGVFLRRDGLAGRLPLEPYSTVAERHRKFVAEVQNGIFQWMKNVMNLAVRPSITRIFERNPQEKEVKSTFDIGSLAYSDRIGQIIGREGNLLPTFAFQSHLNLMAYAIVPDADHGRGKEFPSGMFAIMIQPEKLVRVLLRRLHESGLDRREENAGMDIRYYFMGYSLANREVFRTMTTDSDPAAVSSAVVKDLDRSDSGTPMSEIFSLGQRVLNVGAGGNFDQLGSSSPRLISARMFHAIPCLAIAIATPRAGGGFEASHWRWWGLVGYGILTLLLVSRFLGDLLLRPFQEFVDGIREIARENFGYRIQLPAGREFGLLESSFNKMSRGLLEHRRMEKFVSERVLSLTRAGAEGSPPAAERVQGSVLVSDLRGFTTLSETHPPDQVVEMLNDYFTEMEKAIQGQGGIIDKFIGDAIVAVFFPAPEGEDHATRACRAGLDMRRELAALNAVRLAAGTFAVDNGVALATGEFVSGCVRSGGKRLELGIYGNVVQLAGDLEPLTKVATTSRVVVCPRTAEIARERFVLAPLPALDGVPQNPPVAFEIISPKEERHE